MGESRFTQGAAQALRLARESAWGLGHSYVGSEHLLLGVSGQKESPAALALERAGADSAHLRSAMTRRVGVGTAGGPQQGLTPTCCRAIGRASGECRRWGRKRVNTEDLLMGLLGEKLSGASDLLNDCGVDQAALTQAVTASLGGENASLRERGLGESRAAGDTRTLDQCSRDLTQLAAQGSLDPVIGREEELERIVCILSRRGKNNPALIGEPGVGKTALAEALAQAIAHRTVPKNLWNKRVCGLDLAAMVAGTKYRGEFEDKLRRVLQEVRRAGNVILFIDELHTIMGAGSAEGAIDAANILKPALARGEVQVLGATTLDEYRRHIEKDAALERRFQPVTIREPDRDQTLRILEGLRERYEVHHGLTITQEALRAAVDLSIRYLPERFLPDKAIDLVDEGAARTRLRARELPPELRELENRRVDTERQIIRAVQAQDFEGAARLRDAQGSFRRQLEEARKAWEGQQKSMELGEAEIRAVLSQWTGVPVEDPDKGDRERLCRLEEELKERLVGQDRAVEAVARAIRRSRLGIQDPSRPTGCFLLLGPSGVGKTQLCRSLAELLFGSEKALLRFDMSEYREAHSLSRLIGSPPGYVGHEEGGQLTEQVRRHPWSVVLLDELEKAHRDVWSVLLQVMEEGELTDGLGRTTNFRNTVLIMTSNLGAQRFHRGTALGFQTGDQEERSIEEEIRGDARRTFAPEFLNRLDGLLVFHPLGGEELEAITRRLLGETEQRLHRLGIHLSTEPEAVSLLAQQGKNRAYGPDPFDGPLGPGWRTRRQTSCCPVGSAGGIPCASP